jgi:hypothetical protein
MIGKTIAPRGGSVMSERTAEVVAYAVAGVILIVGGVLLRTAVLNWFVGPMLVVVTVTLLTPLLSRGRSP